MFKTLTRLVTPPPSLVEAVPATAAPVEAPFTLPDLKRIDPRSIERACARLFSTDDGMLVLHHLQSIAFMRAYGIDATDAQIRYAEGQRALVGQLMRLIHAGRYE